MSLKKAVLLGIMGVSLMSFVLVAMLTGFYMEEFMTYTVSRSNSNAIELLVPQVQHYFEHPEGLALNIKKQYELELKGNIRPKLSDLLHSTATDYIRRIERIDNQGLISDVYPFDNNLIGIDTSSRRYQYLELGEGVHKTSTFVDPILRDATMAFRVSTSDGGHMVIYPDLKAIQGFLTNAKLSENSRIGVVDSKGVFVAHNIKSFSDERFSDPLYMVWKKNKQTVFENTVVDGERYSVKISQINNEGWALIVYQSYKDLLSGWISFLSRIIIGLIVIAVLLIVVAFRVYNRISEDINKLMHGVDWLTNDVYEKPEVELLYTETSEIFKSLYESGVQLRDREKEIRELNIDLEKRVVDRTVDLEAMNEELIATIDELQSTQEMLVEARKMAEIGRIVSGVAHEMNTPLGNALTMNSFLEKDIHETKEKFLTGKMSVKQAEIWFADVVESLSIQQNAIRRSTDLVAEFKRLDVNRDMSASWFSMVTLADVIQRSYAPKIVEQNGEMVLEIKDDQIFTDPELLREVINQLIDNVLIHAYEKDKDQKIDKEKLLHLKGFIEIDEYVIQITDNGVGMDQHACEIAFNAFETGGQRLGHAGLGLFLVGSYVRNLLSGDVACISEIGEGTTIEVRIKQPMNLNQMRSVN